MVDEEPDDVELIEHLLVRIGMAMEDGAAAATDQKYGGLKARLSEIGVTIGFSAALHAAVVALTDHDR